MLQRLYEITMLLTQKGHATAGELARRFEVSPRTIYRDIDALSAAGVPVYAERGKGGGIRILPGYVLDKTLFSKEEQAQLVAHFDSLAQLGAPDTQPVLDKLAALFGRSEQWLQIDFAPWEGGAAAQDLFRLLRQAILGRQVVCFGYLSAGDTDLNSGRQLVRTRQARTVEPYRVVFRGQGWYLQAFCRSRGDWRLFKLSRMQDAAPTGEHFVPDKTPPAVGLPQDAPRETVCLRLNASQAYRAADEFAHGTVEKEPGGTLLVTVEMMAGGWLVGYLISFGSAAEVVRPAWLRKAVAEEVARMHKRYGGERP